MNNLILFMKEQKINLLSILLAIFFSLLFQIRLENSPFGFIDTIFEIAWLGIWYFISKLIIVKVLKLS